MAQSLFLLGTHYMSHFLLPSTFLQQEEHLWNIDSGPDLAISGLIYYLLESHNSSSQSGVPGQVSSAYLETYSK